MRPRFGTSLAAALLDSLTNKTLDSASARFRTGEEFCFSCHAPVECLIHGSNYLLWGGSCLSRIDDGALWRGQPDSVADHNFGFTEAPRSRVNCHPSECGTIALRSGNGDMDNFRHYVGKAEDFERAFVRHHRHFFPHGEPGGDNVLAG